MSIVGNSALVCCQVDQTTYRITNGRQCISNMGQVFTLKSGHFASKSALHGQSA